MVELALPVPTFIHQVIGIRHIHLCDLWDPLDEILPRQKKPRSEGPGASHASARPATRQILSYLA